MESLLWCNLLLSRSMLRAVKARSFLVFQVISVSARGLNALHHEFHAGYIPFVEAEDHLII